MLFNSFPFLLLFIVVFAIYYLPFVRKRNKLQNLCLLVASYFFYGYADLKMLPLLFITTAVFFGLGLWLKKEMQKGREKVASRISTLGVCLGIGVLLYFKYLGFFADSFAALFNKIGLGVGWSTVHIVMPIGVSFFTFKLISYVLEIRREHIEPCHDFVGFATFVAFFPTILSGPIDRPDKFLPQLDKNRTFDESLAFDGARQFLWGLFTKLCVADNLASITDSAWQNVSGSSSSTLIIVALLYPLQMYADFDGYSNMAIGISKVLGIKVARNFNHPFLARNIAEYWRNWHISLTGWLTDYVFSPLNIAFRNMDNFGIILAIVINFILIGFWHGANWTFGLFGLYHGLLYVPLILIGAFGKRKKLKATDRGLPLGQDLLKMIGTYVLVAIGLIIFRATNLGESFDYIRGLFSITLFTKPAIAVMSKVDLAVVALFTLVLIILEWLSRKHEYALAYILDNKKQYTRMIICVVLFVVTMLFRGEQSDFIYFQF